MIKLFKKFPKICFREKNTIAFCHNKYERDNKNQNILSNFVQKSSWKNPEWIYLSVSLIIFVIKIIRIFSKIKLHYYTWIFL